MRFAERTSLEQVELGDLLAPSFGADGLLTAVVVDTETRQVLMLGHLNAEALTLTLTTGEAHFWSRSRGALWRKGEHSGFRQEIVRLLVDDDQDALVLEVRVAGPGSCHVGYRSCLYRQVHAPTSAEAPPRLSRVEAEPAFDAGSVYAGLPNPTRL